MNIKQTCKEHKHIVILILIALLVKVFFLINISPWQASVEDRLVVHSLGDPALYHKLALDFLRTFQLRSIGVERTPGYPVFVTLVYYIFGVKPWVVVVIQIILNLISGVFLYRIGNILINKKISLIATSLYLFDPTSNDVMLRVLTETLFTTFLIFSIYCFIKYIVKNQESRIKNQESRIKNQESRIKNQESRIKNQEINYKFTYLQICISAFCLGIATLTRPIAQYFPVIIILLILVFSKQLLRKRINISLLYIGVYLATLSPWLIKNYRSYQHVSLTIIDSWNLLYYNAGYTEMNKTGESFDKVVNKFFIKYISSMPNNKRDTNKFYGGSIIMEDLTPPTDKTYLKSDPENPFYVAGVQRHIALDYIRHNIFWYAKTHLKGILNVFYETDAKSLSIMLGNHMEIRAPLVKNIPKNANDLYNRLAKKDIFVLVITLIIAVYFVLIYSGFIIGCYKLFKSRQFFIFIFALMSFGYFMLLSGPQGESRFKLPFWGIFLLVSVYGFFSDTRTKNQESRTKTKDKLIKS